MLGYISPKKIRVQPMGSTPLAVCLVAAMGMNVFIALFINTYALAIDNTPIQISREIYITNYFQVLPIFCIWTLLYFMIRYFRQFSASEVERLRLAASLKDAQLNTLKGQINPHFMFNSLNNIRALMLEDTSAAREGISNLAEFLRYSLNSDQQDRITLTEELAVVNEFIALAKLKYEDKLQLNMDICEKSKACLIPIMVLQMMIENALKHGIAEQVNGGLLHISSAVQTDRLILQVTNPGQLSQDSKSYAQKKNSTGIGVINIKQRLTLLYGLDAQFELLQHKDKVVARLSLPLEYNK